MNEELVWGIFIKLSGYRKGRGDWEDGKINRDGEINKITVALNLNNLGIPSFASNICVMYNLTIVDETTVKLLWEKSH